jgi:hypothetical protein
MLDQANNTHGSEADARGEALRNSDYASLTRRAATDNSRALVDEVLRLIATVEARERQRGAKAKVALKRAAEAFIGDLLAALARAQGREHRNSVAVAGWIHHSVSPNAFSGGPVSARSFDAVRAALIALALVEEVPSVTQFRECLSGGLLSHKNHL